MKTVAEHLVEALVNSGVRRIYGVVGDSLNSIVDAVHHNRKIEWIHVRHEEAAAFAASAEAQLTGNLAVCAGSCGPGNLHLINGCMMHIRRWRRCLRLRRKYLRPRLALTFSKRPTRSGYFSSAATIAS
jgi:hypothetical protein